MSKIPAYKRSGVWITKHNSYFSFAHEERKRFFLSLEELKNLESGIRKKFSNDPEYLDVALHVESESVRGDAYRHATSMLLYLCMSVEGFINNYGAVRMSPKYYRDNIERQNLAKKVSLIMGICFQEIIDPNDNVLRNIKAMFEERNQLVHPKTRELDHDNLAQYENEHPADLEVDKYFNYVDDFVGWFSKYDDTLDKTFEFNPREKSV